MKIRMTVSRAALALVGLTSLSLVGNVVVLSTLYGAHLRPLATAVAATVMGVGVVAALRHRTWGLFAVALSATAFLSVVFVGIAPRWFVMVAALGYAPLLVMLPDLARFDTAMTAWVVALVLVLGVACAWVAGPGIILVFGFAP